MNVDTPHEPELAQQAKKAVSITVTQEGVLVSAASIPPSVIQRRIESKRLTKEEQEVIRLYKVKQ